MVNFSSPFFLLFPNLLPNMNVPPRCFVLGPFPARSKMHICTFGTHRFGMIWEKKCVLTHEFTDEISFAKLGKRNKIHLPKGQKTYKMELNMKPTLPSEQFPNYPSPPIFEVEVITRHGAESSDMWNVSLGSSGWTSIETVVWFIHEEALLVWG